MARTTLILDEELLEEARRITGLKEKTAVVHEGLKTIVRLETARRLIALGGTMPNLKRTPRRRRRSAER